MSEQNPQARLQEHNIDPMAAIERAEAAKAAQAVNIEQPEEVTPQPNIVPDIAPEPEIEFTEEAEQRMHEMFRWSEATGALTEAKARENAELGQKVIALAKAGDPERAKEALRAGSESISKGTARGQTKINKTDEYRFSRLASMDKDDTVAIHQNGTIDYNRSPRNVRNDALQHGWQKDPKRPQFR